MSEETKNDHVVLETFGDDALVFRPDAMYQRYVVAYGYDAETKSWSHGSYHDSAADAWNEVNPKIVEDLCITVEREDIEECLDGWGFDRGDRNVYEVLGSHAVKHCTKHNVENALREEIDLAIEEIQDDLERDKKAKEACHEKVERDVSRAFRGGIEER